MGKADQTLWKWNLIAILNMFVFLLYVCLGFVLQFVLAYRRRTSHLSGSYVSSLGNICIYIYVSCIFDLIELDKQLYSFWLYSKPLKSEHDLWKVSPLKAGHFRVELDLGYTFDKPFGWCLHSHLHFRGLNANQCPTCQCRWKIPVFSTFFKRGAESIWNKIRVGEIFQLFLLISPKSLNCCSWCSDDLELWGNPAKR